MCRLHAIVAVLVSALVCGSVVAKKRMTWKEFRSLSSKSVRGSWLPNDSHYVYKRNDTLYKYDAFAKSEQVYYSNALLSGCNAWQLSPSGFSLVIATNFKAGYTHYVNTYTYTVIEIDTEKVLFTGDGFQKYKFAPTAASDGDELDKLAFVKDFNIHLFDFVNYSLTQITFDGEENVIFNGITDWLHAVEITDDDCLVFWAPDGKSLVYGQLDQHGVHNFEYNVFLSASEYMYPKRIVLPYPKPGTKLPQMNLYHFEASPENIANIDESNFKDLRVELEPSDEVASWKAAAAEEYSTKGYYLNMARWTDNTTFQATFKNRIENTVINDHCSMNINGPDSRFTCVHADAQRQYSDKGWIGNYKPSDTINGKDESEYFTVESSDTENKNYLTLVRIDLATDERDWRVDEKFEVTDAGSGYHAMHCYDATNDRVFFTSTEDPTNPGQELPRIRHLWSVAGHGSDKTRTCLTCDLDTADTYGTADHCRYIDPSFSDGCTSLIIQCLGTGNTVPMTVAATVGADGSLENVNVLEDNAALTKQITEEYAYRNKTYGTIKLDGDENDYYYSMFYPPNFDPTKKYPMFMEVYAGPAFSWVQDSYSRRWDFEYIASTYNVIVANFDGRGSGFRGNEIMHKNYLQLGTYEPADQIEFAKKISREKDYIDQDNLMIWGRSYGGYATSKIMGTDKEGIFKCGAIVSPVTDWYFYHTIYTERYMQTPDMNPGGYNKSSAIKADGVVENFEKHDRVYMIHGTADDNVHFQNSADLSRFLIRNGVLNLELATFQADENHSYALTDKGYDRHYHLMTRVTEECLGLTPIEADE